MTTLDEKTKLRDTGVAPTVRNPNEDVVSMEGEMGDGKFINIRLTSVKFKRDSFPRIINTEITELLPRVGPATLPDIPIFTVQPPDRKLIAEGYLLRLTPKATGKGTLEYNWLRDGASFTDSAKRILTIDRVDPEFHSGRYALVATNEAGSTVSNPCNIKVYPVDSSPKINTNLVKNSFADEGISNWRTSIGKVSIFRYAGIVEEGDVTFPTPRAPTAGLTNDMQPGKLGFAGGVEEKLTQIYQDIDVSELADLIDGKVEGVSNISAWLYGFVGVFTTGEVGWDYIQCSLEAYDSQNTKLDKISTDKVDGVAYTATATLTPFNTYNKQYFTLPVGTKKIRVQVEIYTPISGVSAYGGPPAQSVGFFDCLNMRLFDSNTLSLPTEPIDVGQNAENTGEQGEVVPLNIGVWPAETTLVNITPFDDTVAEITYELTNNSEEPEVVNIQIPHNLLSANTETVTIPGNSSRTVIVTVNTETVLTFIEGIYDAPITFKQANGKRDIGRLIKIQFEEISEEDYTEYYEDESWQD